MKKFSKEQEEYFRMCIEEAERDIEENGTLTWEEFMEELEKEERRDGIYIKQNTIKLRLASWLGKISRKFIKI